MNSESDELSLLLALVHARNEWNESFIFDIDLDKGMLDRLVCFFLDNGFDRTQVDLEGNTIAHLVVSKGLTGCLEKLKQEKFNPLVRNDCDMLPSDAPGDPRTKEIVREWEYQHAQTWTGSRND
jgi:hypothetical protein